MPPRRLTARANRPDAEARSRPSHWPQARRAGRRWPRAMRDGSRRRLADQAAGPSRRTEATQGRAEHVALPGLHASRLGAARPRAAAGCARAACCRTVRGPVAAGQACRIVRRASMAARLSGNKTTEVGNRAPRRASSFAYRGSDGRPYITASAGPGSRAPPPTQRATGVYREGVLLGQRPCEHKASTSRLRTAHVERRPRKWVQAHVCHFFVVNGHRNRCSIDGQAGGHPPHAHRSSRPGAVQAQNSLRTSTLPRAGEA